MSAGNDGEIDRQAAMGLLPPEELEALQEDDITPEQRAAMEATGTYSSGFIST